ncbi:MAG: DUF5674 family protein [Legionellales bacterium]
MQLVKDKITLAELRQMSEKMSGNLVKAVVDIEQEIMAVDAPMHFDQEQFLLEEGSKQDNLWGINFHPNEVGSDDFIEFDSMINLRPSRGNRTRSVDNPEIQKKIRALVRKLVVL